MNVSIKKAVFVGLGILLLGSLAISGYLFELNQEQAKRYGDLQG